MKFPSASVFFVWLALLASLAVYVSSAVLGIDYGADSFRIAIANPGKHMDVVLNRSSKRKTRSVITLKNLERYFNDDAVSLSGRFPHLTIFDAKSLLGATYDDASYTSYLKKYPVKIVKLNEKGDIAFDLGLPSNKTLLPQEVVAMQLKHAIELTHENEGIKVKDAIITVPSHFGQHERQAMKDAIEIAGINCLGLLNDGSAVALNYAMGKTFPAEPEVHMFIDIGAASTVFTVASFRSKLVKSSGVSKNVTVVNNLGYSIDNLLGGSEMDIRLRDYILLKFEEKYGKSLSSPARSNNRAMARLLKEANRVKTILSVNTEITANLESFHEDIDFSLLITRKDFEGLIGDLASHFVKLVDDALATTGLKSSSIKSVLIAGGGARVPYMIEKISEVFGAERISRGINSDEACVIGSVFKAASTSSLFRVKDIRLRDSYGFAINAVYFQEGTGIFNSGKRAVAPILPKFSTIGIKKSFTDSRASNLDVKFEAESGGKFATFAKASITGVPEALQKVDKSSLVDPKPLVEVNYMLDKYGLFKVLSAYAIFNSTNPAYNDYLDDLKSWNAEAAEAEKLKKAKKSPSSAESAATASDTKSETETETRKPLRPMPATQYEFIITRSPLKVEFSLTDNNSLDTPTKNGAIEFIRRLDGFELEKKTHDEAKNNLEAFIYKVKYFVDESKVLSVTTEEQRTELFDASQKAGEWFEDQSDTTETRHYLDQLDTLKKLYTPIHFRVEEFTRRPKQIQELQSLSSNIKEYLQNVTAKYDEDEIKLVESDMKSATEKLATIEEWAISSQKKQDEIPPHKEPVLLSSDISKKIADLKSLNQSITKSVAKLFFQAKMKSAAAESAASESAAAESASNAAPPSEDTEATPASQKESNSESENTSDSDFEKNEKPEKPASKPKIDVPPYDEL